MFPKSKNKKKQSNIGLYIKNFFLNIQYGFIVAVFFVGVTLIAWSWTKTIVDKTVQREFISVSRELARSVQDRVQLYSNVVVSSRALYDASDFVSRDEWEAYILSQNIEETYPGVQAFEFAERVLDEDREEFVQRIRDEGFTDFDIFFENGNEISGDHYVVNYIVPFEGNEDAFGLDLSSNPSRLEGLELARDNNTLSFTQPIELGERGRAYLISLPVYKKDFPLDTVEERRSALGGFVIGLVNPDLLFSGLSEEIEETLGITFRIIDSASGEIVFAKDDYSIDDINYENLRYDIDLLLANRQWDIQISPEAGFIDSFILEFILPEVFLAVGLVLSFLLLAVFYLSGRSRTAAIVIARNMTSKFEAEQERVKASLKEKEKQEQKMLNLLDIMAKDKDRMEETDRRLRLVTQRLRIATESANIGVWTWDVVNDKLEWDDIMYSLYGVDKKDFTGAYEAWQKGLHPEDRERGDKDIKDALAGKRNFDTEFRVVWPDNSVHYIKAYGDVIRDKKGKPLSMIGVNWDITHEKHVDQAKTEFVSLASHQLRTPLSAVNWYTEMLLAGDAGKLNKEQRDFISEVYKSNNRMTMLVNSLLNVSRIEMGTFMVEPKPTQLRELAKDVVKELTPQIKKKKQKLTQKYDKLPKLNVDPQLTTIIFQNLLSNAVKYTPPKGSIDFSIELKKNHVLITVEDTGMGIPANQQDDIFTKLFRADNVKKKNTKGTGLGLYLAKSIVEQSKGKIWFKSKEGSGTTFYVKLPLEGMKKKKGSKRLGE